MSDLRLLRVGCVCGWEIVGTEDEIVPAVIEHGERIHNMKGTREQVLANAQPVDSATRSTMPKGPSRS